MIEFFNATILRMVRIRMWVAAVLLLTCGAAFAQTITDKATASDAPPPTQDSLKLLRVIIALPSGTPWLSMKHGWLCINPTTETWASGRVPQALPPYSDLFKTGLARAGYKVITPGEDNLFDEDASSADYEVAALIVDEHIDGCASGITGDVKGDSAMKIDWQIYSPITKQVVAHVSTSASAALDNSVPGGVARLLLESFAANVRELASSTDLRTAVNAPKALTDGFFCRPRRARSFLLAV